MGSHGSPKTYRTIGENSISYQTGPQDLLGPHTAHRPRVYRGKFNGSEVAVKKIFLDFIGKEEREIQLKIDLDHENVLKILGVETDDDFRYIAMELCAGTLEQFIKQQYKGPMPSDVKVMYQIVCGVDYIHSKNLIHCDIKPENILISCTSPVVMKISDFGFCKTKIRGFQYWTAPEFLQLQMSPNEIVEIRGSIQSDIFSIGCVLFYFLKRGTHPFGKGTWILKNILNNKPVHLKELHDHFAYNLIQNMIKSNENKRIVLKDVIKALKNPFTVIPRSHPQTSVECFSRFHPTDSVLACGSGPSVAIFKAVNWSIPFSDWKVEQEFKNQIIGVIKALEWNVNGTQLAAGYNDGSRLLSCGVVILWSYPSGRVLFNLKNQWNEVNLIAWNPFKQNIFTTRDMNWDIDSQSLRRSALLFWNTTENGDAAKANHNHTQLLGFLVSRVAWISANQIAIGRESKPFFNFNIPGGIRIYEIDNEEGRTTSRLVKSFDDFLLITGLKWNESTEYLASASQCGWIKIWSMGSEQPVHSLELGFRCFSLDWRPNAKKDADGRIDDARKAKENFTIACGLEGGSIAIWNPLEEDEANRKRILPQKHSSTVKSLSFSPDGRFFASADERGEIIIWSTETWASVFSCQNHSLNNHSLSWMLNQGLNNHSLSWMSLGSSSVPSYKLAVPSNNQVRVIEQALIEGQYQVWTFQHL